MLRPCGLTQLVLFSCIVAALWTANAWALEDEAKITLVQLTVRGKTPDSVIERMPVFFEQAAQYGSDLIVFPEYVLGNLITVAHPRVQAFFQLAREHEMYAIAGLVESHGERWATTALVVDRQGKLLGRYYKCRPASGPPPHCWPPLPGQDHEARGILGNQFKVFHLDFGPIGVLQCYDGYFPEAWGCTSFNGAEIILWDYPECQDLVNQAQLDAPTAPKD